MSAERNLREVAIKTTSKNGKPSNTDDMSSITASIISHDHFSTSRASMSLASVQGSQTANDDDDDDDDIMETSTLGSSNTTRSLRKRKLEGLMPAAGGTRDPKDRWKESTGLTMLSFPLKLHRFLHEYELSCEEHNTKRRPKLLEEKKKAKLENQPSATSKTNNDQHGEKIIGWVQGGTAFQIFDQVRFVDEIMPKYFSQSSFREFQKDLVLW